MVFSLPTFSYRKLIPTSETRLQFNCDRSAAIWTVREVEYVYLQLCCMGKIIIEPSWFHFTDSACDPSGSIRWAAKLLYMLHSERLEPI